MQMTIEQQQKELEQIYKSRGFNVRPHAIKNTIGDYINPCSPHVTAVGTSGGKTILTAGRLEFLYKFGFIKSDEKVLILSADKTILRGNFFTQFNSFFNEVGASFTYRPVASKKELNKAVKDGIQVIITLPQTIQDDTTLSSLSKLNFKWFVQDEAHKWYFQKTIKRIIKQLKPKHQSLLTGTPFKFNMQNKRKANSYLIEYTAVGEMYENGYLSDIEAHVLHSNVALTKLDYVNMLGNLKKSKRITNAETIKAFENVVDQLINKIKVPFKGQATTHNITKNITSVFGKLQKTIIFTHGIDEAECLYEYLINKGINVLITHSKRKEKSDFVFENFKNPEKNFSVLIAVNQGKEGFDFPELFNVIDMTYSQNFEVVMQIIGRVLRKSDTIKYKYFFKVAPKDTASYFVNWMNALFMLFDEEWYSKFDGKNGFDIEIPNTLINRGNRSVKGSRGKSRPSNKGNFKPSNLDNFNSLSFMSTNKWFKLNSSLSTVATTTLGKICDLHNAEKTLKEWKQELINNTQLTTEPKSTLNKVIDPVEYLNSWKSKQEKTKTGKSLTDLKKLFIK